MAYSKVRTGKVQDVRPIADRYAVSMIFDDGARGATRFHTRAELDALRELAGVTHARALIGERVTFDGLRITWLDIPSKAGY